MRFKYVTASIVFVAITSILLAESLGVWRFHANEARLRPIETFGAVGRTGEGIQGIGAPRAMGPFINLEWPSNRWQHVPLLEIEFEETQNLLGLNVVDRSHALVVGDKGFD